MAEPEHPETLPPVVATGARKPLPLRRWTLLLVPVVLFVAAALWLVPSRFWEAHWGDISSVLGVIIGIATIVVATRAKKAAEAARNAVLRFDAIVELSRAVEVL